MKQDSLEQLTQRAQRFAAERDWEQFHSPKNLAMAVVGEAGELAACFQWMSETQSLNLDDEARTRAGEEVADVLIYLVRLADRLGIDPVAVTERKMWINEQRYPAAQVRGSSKKYNEY